MEYFRVYEVEASAGASHRLSSAGLGLMAGAECFREVSHKFTSKSASSKSCYEIFLISLNAPGEVEVSSTCAVLSVCGPEILVDLRHS